MAADSRQQLNLHAVELDLQGFQQVHAVHWFALRDFHLQVFQQFLDLAHESPVLRVVGLGGFGQHISAVSVLLAQNLLLAGIPHEPDQIVQLCLLFSSQFAVLLQHYQLQTVLLLSKFQQPVEVHLLRLHSLSHKSFDLSEFLLT